MMRLHRLVCATIAGFLSIAGAAAPTFPADSVYRLVLAEPDAFRLATDSSGASAKEDADTIVAESSEARITQEASAQLRRMPFYSAIEDAARAVSLDPALVHAVVFVESRYNAKARSPKGAVGLMQVLPETASRYGISDASRSPEANLRAGARHLSYLLQYFKGRLDLALAAYNAGENAVLRHGLRVPPYAETLAYVPAVLAKYHELRKPPPAPPPTVNPPQPFPVEYLPGTRLEQNVRNLAAPHYRDDKIVQVR